MGSVNNKPVAIRYDFDGYGYQYMDSGSGSDWQSRVKGEPLYTHPVKEQRMIDVLMELSKYRLLSKDEIEEIAILRKAQEK